MLTNRPTTAVPIKGKVGPLSFIAWLVSVAAIFVLASLMSVADEPPITRIELGDGYDLLVSDFLSVQDRNDRGVLSVGMLAPGATVFYSELGDTLLFKIEPGEPGGVTVVDSIPGVRYYVLPKGQKIDGSAPLSRDAFIAKLQVMSLREESVQWHLAAPEPDEGLSPFEMLRGIYHGVSFSLGYILPIPFAVLVVRYVKLIRRIRHLKAEQRRLDEGRLAR